MRWPPMLRLFLMAVSLGAGALSGGAGALPPIPTPAASPAPALPTCGPEVLAPAPSAPLPEGVTGRVSFYAALYDPRTLQVLGDLGLGPINALFPLASSFKGVLVEKVLEDVDAGRLSLTTPLTTSASTRSLGAYPKGTNTLAALARTAIADSNNTAADLLMLAYGPARLTRAVQQMSPCTTMLLTTKAWWTAQAGLAAPVLGPDVRAGAAAYAALPLDARIERAQALIAASQMVTAPQLDAALDRYFRGPGYTPELELDLQPTSTASAYTALVARTFSGAALRPATRQFYRAVMASGCCYPHVPTLRETYWGAKAGSGWRLLTMSGFAELPDGRLLAYTYLNDRSDATDSEQIERQLRPLEYWVEAALKELAGPP